MPSITNVGGSLTSAVALTLLAWGVRTVRARAVKNKAQQVAAPKRHAVGRFFSALSPTAVRVLIEDDPTLHLLFDIRGKDAWDSSPLPLELRSALRSEVSELDDALCSVSTWRERYPEVPYPHEDTILLFITDEAEAGLDASAIAAIRGFQRTAVIERGLSAFLASPKAQTAQMLKWINRDALALLLDGARQEGGVRPHVVIDVRRADERTLFGTIPGVVHIPVDQLPSALHLPPDQFKESYHFPKPSPQDAVVMLCRSDRRAHWAALLARDLGWSNSFVYKQGVYGWRLHATVKPYDKYQVTEAAPEPLDFNVETVDLQGAKEELLRLGLLIAPARGPE